MTELLILLVGGLFAYYLWDSQGAKERASALARQACQQRHLQFLDFSVVSQSTRVKRSTGGQPQWQRQYGFEFHVGGASGHIERYNATMELLGKQLVHITFDPYPMPDEPIDYVDGPGRCMRR